VICGQSPKAWGYRYYTDGTDAEETESAPSV